MTYSLYRLEDLHFFLANMLAFRLFSHPKRSPVPSNNLACSLPRNGTSDILSETVSSKTQELSPSTFACVRIWIQACLTTQKHDHADLALQWQAVSCNFPLKDASLKLLAVSSLPLVFEPSFPETSGHPDKGPASKMPASKTTMQH